VIAGVLYVIVKPICDAFILRLPLGSHIIVWSFKCGKCGKELFISPGYHFVYFTKPKDQKLEVEMDKCNQD
jgi:hypothetical protein